MLTQILFLWGRENPEYGYKQGMNEVLAILAIVFDTERVAASPATDLSALSDEQVAQDHLLSFLFDPAHIRADIYACFDRILRGGIQYLYMDTKDLTELRKDREKRNTAEERKKRDLFEFSMNAQQERQQKQRELE